MVKKTVPLSKSGKQSTGTAKELITGGAKDLVTEPKLITPRKDSKHRK